MQYLKPFLILVFILTVCNNYGQSAITPPKESVSEEVITKTIRIKGANGEEKVIQQQQVISKKSSVELNPEEKDKTNMTATYTPEEVSVKNMGATSNQKIYSSVPDGNGFVITFIDEKGEKIGKARPIDGGYYLINRGANDNCVGRFDDKKNLVLEVFDSKSNDVVKVSYKLK